MAKKKDLQSLGEAYGAILDKVVVSENVPAGTIGEAPLEKGGPTERGGFKESDVDINKVGDKENAYNIKGLSYGDGNDPGTNCDRPLPTSDDIAARYGIVGKEEDEEDETEEDDVNKVEADIAEDEESKAKKDYDGDGKVESSTAEYMGSRDKAIKKARGKKPEEEEEDTVDEDELPVDPEESEESSEEIEKIAEEGLNIFMKRKSVFDKLYDKVMVNEDFGGGEHEEADLDALGLDDAETDADAEGEVTVTLDREMAQHLCDVLKAACGDEDEVEAEVELDDEDEQFPAQFEEDEEGEPTAMNTHYNDGKQNKVGSLKNAGGAASTGATGKVDAGSNMNTHYNDGKQNKVGNLKPGSSAFE